MSKLITSSGGHVYDRTTGTWEGATQGSFGDGKDHGIQQPGKVWHDANGIAGIQLLSPQGNSDRGGSAGPASSQVASNATSATPIGEGPGAPAVTQGGKGGGGSGSGSKLVVGMPGVWWDEAGKASAVPGSFVNRGDLPMLQPVMKGTNTAVMIGGIPILPHPGTSDAADIEDFLGEGDSPLELAWWAKQAAGFTHIDYNVKAWANDPETQEWAKEFDRGVMDLLTPW